MFLSLVLNCLYSNDDSYQVLGQAFDSIHYQNLDIKFPHAHSRTYDDIGIIIDNELLWLHQLLCRTSDKNYHINDYENNFIELSKNHPILTNVIDDFISMNRSIYPRYKKKKLKWFYQNKIFGKICPMNRLNKIKTIGTQYHSHVFMTLINLNHKSIKLYH